MVSPSLEGSLLSLSLGEGLDNPQQPCVLWCDNSYALAAIESRWITLPRLQTLTKIRGDWAAALWDPSSNRYLLAVDPLGLHPLFWTQTDERTLLVSSWLDELLSHQSVDSTLDYEGILLDAGLGLAGATQRTRFRSVRRVPGGHALSVSPDGSTRLVKYWNASSLSEPDETLSLGDSVSLLRDSLTNAVSAAVAGNDAIGAHSSGGLDCTAVALMAQESLRARNSQLVAGYSWAPDYTSLPPMANDERELVERVRALGVPIRYSPGPACGSWFWQKDPNRYAQSTHVYEAATLAQARQDGVQVLLSGWGGDEFASFNGRRIHRELIAKGRLHKLWQHESQRQVLAGQRADPLRTLGRLLNPALVEMRLDAHRARHPVQTARTRRQSAEALAQLRSYSPWVAEIREEYLAGFTQARDRRSYQIHLLTGGHLQHRTMWWYQSGRAMAVTYRYPLLDLDVIDTALRLPWWAYLNGGWRRIAFRQAVAGSVPQEIVWNPDKREPALRHKPPGWETTMANLLSRPSPTGDNEYDHVKSLIRVVMRLRPTTQL